MRTLPLLFACLSALLITDVQLAHAQEADAVTGVQCKVYTIAARDPKAPLPKELAEFKDILSKVPFKAYGSFELRQKSEIVLNTQKPVKTKLSGNLHMTSRLIEKILEGKNKVRYRIQMQIQKEGTGKEPRTEILHNMTVKLAAEMPMFVAGPKENNDTLVFGLICK